MKITKTQLKQIIKEELEAAIDEGFLDRLKSKAKGHVTSVTAGGGIDRSEEGEKSGGLAQIDFQIKMGHKYQNALQKMSQSIAKDAKKMAGDKDFQRRMQSIMQILNKAAKALDPEALRAAEGEARKKEREGRF
jgi:hypothetical protein